MDFKINVGNYFGVDHETYFDNLQAFAITKPSEYMQMRAVIIEKAKKDNMVMIYNLFYNLLTTGYKSDGSAHILTFRDSPATREWIDLFVPNMSKQQVSEKLLTAVKTMNKIMI